MEFQDIGLIIPSILPPTVITTEIKFLNKKVLKCLWVSKFVNIGILRPATLPQVIFEVVDVGIF